MNRFAAFVGVGLLWLAGCGEGAGPEPTPPTEIRIVSGADVSDTVEVSLPAPLVVALVQGTGTAGGGRVVEFSALAVEGRPSVLLRSENGAPGGGPWHAVDTTDATGQARVQVQLGPWAGPAGVVITAPGSAAESTAHYTIRPGRPVRLELTPGDTALYVGRTYALQARVRDRNQNARDTTASFLPADGPVELSNGGAVTARAVGRARIIAQLGGMEDTAWTSVVPVGVVAGHLTRAIVGDQIGIAILNLDGSTFERVAVEVYPGAYGGEEPPGRALEPRWDPTGTTIVYQEGGGSKSMFTLDAAGRQRPVLATSPFETEIHPGFSPDGAWIYFAASQPASYQTRLWRVHPDGTGLEQLTVVSEGSAASYPDVSPDGTWLAYSVGNRVHVTNLQTGERTALDVQGSAPRWSPQGDLIAYSDGHALKTVRPDGTEERHIIPAVAYAPGVSWSPDGSYLVAKVLDPGPSVLEVIEVATETRLPLAFTYRLRHPSWRP